ncbi:MAG TPA: PHP domain-containing protein [Candidatus Cryosericum sp.]|nr:PHP domain-containing protein [Candidatus Cryosericum sp.]
MTEPTLRKVDLHVHTVFSNFRHLKALRARDSYSDPLRVYDRCREVGCDYVAITDHDTIDGALDLLSRRPDLEPTVIVGEEVETFFPDTGQWAHVNVLGVDEATHADLQRVKGNIHELVPYLRSRNLVHFLNHPLQSYRMQKKPMRFVEDVLELFTHVEIGNGTLPPDQNRATAGILEYGRRLGLVRFGVGGSDAHGLRHIGAFVTLAPGDDKAAWLASVADGNCLVAGREIGLVGLVGQVYGLIGHYYGHLGTPEDRRRMTPYNYLAAATFVPACIGGVPLFMSLLSYLGTSGMSRVVEWSMTRAAIPGPADSRVVPVPQEEPE